MPFSTMNALGHRLAADPSESRTLRLTSEFDRNLVSALPRLRRFALTLTREQDAARDLVQQTAVRALAAPAPPEGSAAVLPWLLAIARNLFIDERRRLARQTVDWLLDESTDGNEAMRILAVRQALARLDPDCRAVIELVDIEGSTYKEAAHALSIPIGTVMSRVSRARRKLLADLTTDGRRA